MILVQLKLQSPTASMNNNGKIIVIPGNNINTGNVSSVVYSKYDWWTIERPVHVRVQSHAYNSQDPLQLHWGPQLVRGHFFKLVIISIKFDTYNLMRQHCKNHFNYFLLNFSSLFIDLSCMFVAR